MNKTEQAYAEHLEAQRQAGDIAWFEFEPFKLRLAPKCFLTPDFGVMTADGFLELHEVKGFWEDDARVKVKTCADKYWMFKFVVVKKRARKHGGGWHTEVINHGNDLGDR